MDDASLAPSHFVGAKAGYFNLQPRDPVSAGNDNVKYLPTLDSLVEKNNSQLVTAIMSFDQLSSLESQPTTMRRQDDPQYADDPEFQRLSQELMSKLFSLTGNISRLSNEVALLGTRRDTPRVRERVHDLLEESKEAFKEVGEGVKKIQAWEDVSVRI